MESTHEHRIPEFAYFAVILSLMTIAVRATNNMVITTVPPLAENLLDFSNNMVGVLAALSFLTTFISTSYLNPRLAGQTRRKVFILSNLAMVAVMFLFYASNAVTIWFIVMVAGFAGGIIMPNLITSASMLKDAKATERLLAIYTTSLSASLIIGPSIETQILKFFDYRTVFLFFAALAATGFVLSFAVRFPDVRSELHGKILLKNTGFLSSLLANSTYSVPFAAITTFLVIYASDRFGVSRSMAYLSFIPFFAVSFITRLTLAIFPLNTLRPIFIYSVLVTLAGLAGMVVSPSFVLFLAVMALLGFPHGSIFPMSTILIARGSSREERSAVNSYFLAFNNLLFAGVPFAVGFLSSFIGLGYSFLVLTLPVALSATLFLAMFRNDKVITSL
jgi:predicted MFS family arabinose efflux permease